jgi:uncharacterized protein (TIGR01244 family)
VPQGVTSVYRFIRTALPALLIAIAAATAFAAAPTPGPIKQDVPGIVNFSEITGNTGIGGSVVGFGGATAPAAMQWLHEQGFTTVINLRSADETGADVDATRAAAEAVGLRYVHVPYNPQLAPAEIAPAVHAFLETLGARQNQPVYVHCNSATRAAAFWMIARVLDDHWQFDAAAAEAQSIAGKPAVAVDLARKYLDWARPTTPHAAP